MDSERVVDGVYIEGFRGIRRLSREIKFRKFNVVIGRNNVGKTALLEALYLLPSPYTSNPFTGESRLAFVSSMHSGHRGLVYGYADSAKIVYRVKDLKIVVEICADGGARVYIDDRAVTEIECVERLSKVLNIPRDDVRNLIFFVPHTDAFLKNLDEVLRSERVWSAIVKRGLARHIVSSLINPIVHDHFTEVLIERDRLKLRKEVSQDIGPLYIDVSDLGDGIERLCLVALALEYLRPRLVLWDDIEASAHPGLIETVLRWLASRSWQVVITTHSIDVLLELVRVYPRDCAVIALRKTRDDIVESKLMELDEVEDLLDKGIDVRRVVEELEL